MTFTDYKDEDGDIIIMAKERLPSGMTVQIEFCLYELYNIEVANVYLNVYHKRKQISDNTLHQTGKDGIYPFVWAIRKIREFEEYAKHSLSNPLPTYIQVHWEDNRRARIYKRFLQREGFEIRNFGIGNQLYKYIETD